MDFAFEAKTQGILTQELLSLEKTLKGDILYYKGSIFPNLDSIFRKVIEELKEDDQKKGLDGNKLYIILTTPGGDVETVERMVNIIRHHYQTVNFIIPNMAMSAGTVLALSGDDIYMNYASSLGPIDPQVCKSNGDWVPVRGYLKKVADLLEKSRKGELTDAEYGIFHDLDLARLTQYEQACSLTIDLLGKWLVKYKFKNWTRTEGKKKKVTPAMKEARAKEIAEKLGDDSIWLSHGRSIGIQRLQEELKLKIIDYTGTEWYKPLETYCEMMDDYHMSRKIAWYMHTRTFII